MHKKGTIRKRTEVISETEVLRLPRRKRGVSWHYWHSKQLSSISVRNAFISKEKKANITAA